jgi:hypothetical protein
MIYKVASRLFFAIGTLIMFVPVIAKDNSFRLVFIGGGMLLGFIGVMLMGVEPEKKKDDDILDNEDF